MLLDRVPVVDRHLPVLRAFVIELACDKDIVQIISVQTKLPIGAIGAMATLF
jgi:hypothetical protein